MIHLIPIPILALTVLLLIQAVLQDKDRRVYLFKPLSTMLVILICLLSLARPTKDAAYTWALFAGLLFSLGGDIALMFPSDRAFLLGVASFLIAQVVYALTFGLLGGLHRQQIPIAAILAIVGGGFYAYMYRYLGKMKVPVGIYALAISFMVLMATGTLYSPHFSAVQSRLATIGAVLFYLSDVILALNKFAHPFRMARVWNLALYYSGQLLIALSASYALGTL